MAQGRRRQVIYVCYGGAHSSPLAAAIHLGRIAIEPRPPLADIAAVLYFDVLKSEDRGRILPVGVDGDGHEVFVLGRGSNAHPILRAIRSGYLLAGRDPRQLLFVDSSSAVNWQMRIGGFLSRHLGWTTLGRPLAIKGARKAFPRLVAIVKETKNRLSVLGHDSGSLP